MADSHSAPVLALSRLLDEMGLGRPKTPVHVGLQKSAYHVESPLLLGQPLHVFGRNPV